MPSSPILSPRRLKRSGSEFDDDHRGEKKKVKSMFGVKLEESEGKEVKKHEPKVKKEEEDGEGQDSTLVEDSVDGVVKREDGGEGEGLSDVVEVHGMHGYVTTWPRVRVCQESHILGAMMVREPERPLVTGYLVQYAVDCIKHWLEGEVIDFAKPPWDCCTYPVWLLNICRFAKDFSMARMGNEVSNVVRTQALSPSGDRIWSLGSDDTVLDIKRLLHWLGFPDSPNVSIMDTMVKQHLAYHIANKTSAGKELAISQSWTDLLTRHNPLSSEILTLATSNDGAGPKHPSAVHKWNFEEHTGECHYLLSVPAVIVTQSQRDAIKKVLLANCVTKFDVEGPLCSH